ncbi:MAG: hypothetical protein AAFQ14_09005 [Cyanobacteria bacterium J06621_12]
MTTHFITAEINLEENPAELNQKIEARLKQDGEPLRWAVTQIDKEQQTATVEAVVTQAQAN